ncbi:hypothetical protein KQI52_06605 [bacterium]|nr:hypothetical protein [bacterium]
MNQDHMNWWSNLNHGGMLLDIERLGTLVQIVQDEEKGKEKAKRESEDRIRKDLVRQAINSFKDDPDKQRTEFASKVFIWACGFNDQNGTWHRGTAIDTSWSRRGIGNASIRPQQLWRGPNGATVPVFIDNAKKLGQHRGTRVVSRALQWLRKGREQMAVITNGHQWRILFAGLDYEAFVEWDIEQWFFEGDVSPEFEGFRTMLHPTLWIPSEPDKPTAFLHAIQESRKGQSDLSLILGERVRQATEILIQAHAPALNDLANRPDEKEIYRAAVRMVMRIVIGLFAESREGLLPVDNPVYNNAYSLNGLREHLERTHKSRLRESYYAWPRLVSLMRLLYHGSDHQAFPVPTYGGDLFAPGDEHSPDGMRRTVHLFEHAFMEADVMSDLDVREMLRLLTRTKVKIRQGRAATWVNQPVDFSKLGSEYIGILYEGLLDFELKQARPDEPIVFLGVGNQPALPLNALEAMDDKAVADLLKNEKKAAQDDGGSDDAEELAEAEEDTAETESGDEAEDESGDEDGDDDTPDTEADEDNDTTDDTRYSFETRAWQWAENAVIIGMLVKKPRGKLTPEKQDQHQQAIQRRARKLISKLVLPDEWYLVRWGGTRKGSGTWYTPPQLAIPTVHRTLQPLCYDPPEINDKPDRNAPASNWVPKVPEAILKLKVCDPACGSGSFLLAALRYLTDALYESLILHDRVRDVGERSLLELIWDDDHTELLSQETVPVRYGDDSFELRTKVILRRYVVERCVYGVDLDALAVELSRLSLWIETLDHSLPMTFLDHKIKVGNSLVGAWFDQFLHYPIMAWEREGGDKNHTNGVHYRKEEWTKAIKARAATAKKDMKAFIIGSRFPSLYPIDLSTVRTEHDAAVQAMDAIHALGIAQVDQRAEQYAAFRSSDEFRRIKDAFDLWCALWFWPPDEIDEAPMPTAFTEGRISDRASRIVNELSARLQFFHWELEFPDVFNVASEGFDATVGNPPWETLQPNSKEYFGEVDPLYRSYGKQEALRKQKDYFRADRDRERDWLEFNSYFRGYSHWMKAAGHPFGDRVITDKDGTQKHQFPLGRGKDAWAASVRGHQLWKAKRERSTGYADQRHAFRYQGDGKAYTYKMFLELAYALVRSRGRVGMIVPSGVYSDHGSVEIRQLFLDQSSWEWLFGIENREKVFDIDSRFKFNPVIVEKDGETKAIHTAFMRRDIAEWEQPDPPHIDYPYDQVLTFSPNSRAILEIQSDTDLEILNKIYANSVLLGDDGPDGWGIKYAQGDFNMTSDSHLFPPRPKWEEWGYKPDEYSRWIKGPWQPIETLWAELGVDPDQPRPLDPECERTVEDAITRGDAARTGDDDGNLFDDGARRRCAQPPYDTLPIPRADIPVGIILSRNADEWIRESDIPTVTFTEANGKPLVIKKGAGKNKVEIEVTGPAIALPLYEGRMIGQFDFSEKGWVSGKGRGAKWRNIPWSEKSIDAQYLMPQDVYVHYSPVSWGLKLSHMRVGSATNSKSAVGAAIYGAPAGDTAAIFWTDSSSFILNLAGVFNSSVFDFLVRTRLVGLHLDYHVFAQSALPKALREVPQRYTERSAGQGCSHVRFAPHWLQFIDNGSWQSKWASSTKRRLENRSVITALAVLFYDISFDSFKHILAECDLPVSAVTGRGRTQLNPKGFWRVDKEKPPELRQTVLTLVAFHDLMRMIDEYGGDRDAGIEAFLNQNDGEGWMLPETLRLADYGLGHDDRALEHQPVRSEFGPRFYDWQLAQTPDESWRECHLHARNLLGEDGYHRLLRDIESGKSDNSSTDGSSTDNDSTAGRSPDYGDAARGQRSIFPPSQPGLFDDNE